MQNKQKPFFALKRKKFSFHFASFRFEAKMMTVFASFLFHFCIVSFLFCSRFLHFASMRSKQKNTFYALKRKNFASISLHFASKRKWRQILFLFRFVFSSFPFFSLYISTFCIDAKQAKKISLPFHFEAKMTAHPYSNPGLLFSQVHYDWATATIEPPVLLSHRSSLHAVLVLKADFSTDTNFSGLCKAGIMMSS